MSSDKDLTITIQSGRGSREFTFAKQTKVQDAAKQAAVALGYPDGNTYALCRVDPLEELAGERPLVSYQIKDGDILALSDTGSGA